MNEVFAPVKLLLRPKKENFFNFTFNLHTKYTVVMILACSLLLCAQFAREPITCLPGSKLLQEKMVDAFCWVNGTFTMPDLWLRRDGLVSPGVGFIRDDAPKKYQYYYQWLGIILLIQASLFYLPRYVWKMWEGQVLVSLLPVTADTSSNADVKSECGGGPISNDQCIGKKNPSCPASLVKFFLFNSYRRRAFVCKFMICELLNVCNVIAQFLSINYVFSDCFLFYGYNVIRFFWSNQDEFYISPMDEIFPKLAKCTFYKFGPSGTVEVIDSLCLLGWNIIYEKIYFVMWWWFVVLIFFSIVNWFIQVLTLFSRTFRVYVLKNATFFTKTATLQKIARKTNYSDIFILCRIAKQMKHETFEKFLEELSQRL